MSLCQLRLMQNELVVEDVIRDRSTKVSQSHHLIIIISTGAGLQGEVLEGVQTT